MRRLAFLLACTTSALLGGALPAAAQQQQSNAAPAQGPSRTFTGADLFGAMPLTTFWRNTTCPDGTVTNTGCPT